MWKDIEIEKPPVIGEYKVKLKILETGYLEEFKAFWVTKEGQFYSSEFPVSKNNSIVAWRSIE